MFEKKASCSHAKAAHFVFDKLVTDVGLTPDQVLAQLVEQRCSVTGVLGSSPK